MNVMFLGDGGVTDDVRGHLPAKEMSILGMNVLVRKLNTDQDLFVPDINTVVMIRPFRIDLIQRFRDSGTKIVVDMDDNFHAIPPAHPGYKSIGKGNPAFLAEVEKCFRAADLVTTTTTKMAEYLGDYNANIKIIPNGWSRKSKYWDWRLGEREEINIGWLGTITHREDFLIVKDPLTRILKSHPQTRVVIGGDPHIYDMFEKAVPERQKLFLPGVPYEYYPHLLGYMDIMVVPLQNNTFNQYKSDIKLVDAAAKRIPYIASSLHFYKEWGVGGLIVDGSQGFLDGLDRLILDQDCRKELVAQTEERRREREMNQLVKLWVEAITP
jgi:hypothetical protein